jgi:hypothetical protein
MSVPTASNAMRLDYFATVMRAVLCDFDGVIRLWRGDHVARIEDELSLPAGTLSREAFRPQLLRLAPRGVISDEEWRQRVATSLVAQHGDSARDALAAWSRLQLSRALPAAADGVTQLPPGICRAGRGDGDHHHHHDGNPND